MIICIVVEDGWWLQYDEFKFYNGLLAIKSVYYADTELRSYCSQNILK